jgi:hypothetical protein
VSGSSLIHDPKAGGDVEANLDFAAGGLTIFDRGGRKLQHWPYGEIIHAFAASDRRDEVLAHPSRREIHLQVPDDAVFRALSVRAPQLRRLRISWVKLWDIVPEEFHFAFFLAVFGSSAVGIYVLWMLLE